MDDTVAVHNNRSIRLFEFLTIFGSFLFVCFLFVSITLHHVDTIQILNRNDFFYLHLS